MHLRTKISLYNKVFINITREEVDRYFNLSLKVLNDDITKRYHADDYFKIGRAFKFYNCVLTNFQMF